MLYFLWLDYLRETDMHLFEDRVVAWPWGPDLPSVHAYYSWFVDEPLENLGGMSTSTTRKLMKESPSG
jgi:uncharacterized phage-associated protein